MYTIDEIFDAIDNSIELELNLIETEENPKWFMYAIMIWESGKQETLKWYTFSALPNWLGFIMLSIKSLFPENNCPYSMALYPLGYESDEENLKRLQNFLFYADFIDPDSNLENN
jgi:hypothetical protein